MPTDRAADLYAELPREVVPLERPDRVLTVGAHPDDAEFGAGATLARWADAGAHIVLCVLTDGSKGSWDPDLVASELIERRRREQRSAASILGVADVVHLDHVDGDLVMSLELRDTVAELIRRHRPDVVLGHDPWQRYQLHPDHRAAGWALVDGVVAARESRALASSPYPAHRPRAILLWSADEPDHAEPFTPQTFERKVEALLCHGSQATTTMGDADRGPAERARFVERLQDWHRDAGRRLGAPAAEVFRRLTP